MKQSICIIILGLIIDMYTLIRRHGTMLNPTLCMYVCSKIKEVCFASGGYLAHYGEGSGAVSIRDVMCSGTEHNITSCVYYNDTVDDSHSDDVGVQCQQG